MKLYQLIKDLQSEGVKFTHLITLDTLITQLEKYVSESGNKARAWDITVRFKDALKEPVTFSMFDKYKTNQVYLKGLEKCRSLNRFVNDEIEIYPLKQEIGIRIYDEALNPTVCHTFEDLARATKSKPFELEVK